MISKGTLDNLSSVEDEQALLHIFPTEVWLVVCQSRLRNLELTRKISHSSPYFQNLLHPLRTKFLFPQVLMCMRKYLPVNAETDKLLRKLRRICTFWLKTVQRLVHEDILGFYNFESMNIWQWQERACIAGNLYTILRAEEEVINFQQHFQATHLDRIVNPFPSNFLYIMYNAAESPPGHFQALQALFDRCGHHVNRLVVDIMDWHNDINLLELRRVLDVLPNVKFLTVLLINDGLTLERNTDILPFGTYKNLEYISVHGFRTGLVFHALLRNNRHVKSLGHVGGMHEKPSQWLHAEPMPNLEELRTPFLLSRKIQLLSSPTVNWPLKRLALKMSCKPISSWTEKMQRCFDVLEQKFAATLTDLHLSIHDSQQAHTLRLNLPCLASLVLKLTYPVPLDFILPLKSSLTDLEITVLLADEDDYVEEKSILFFSVANNLLSSNIWQLFPKLQQIKYREGLWGSETKICRVTELSRNTVLPFLTQEYNNTFYIRCNRWQRAAADLTVKCIDQFSGSNIILLLCVLVGIGLLLSQWRPQWPV